MNKYDIAICTSTYFGLYGNVTDTSYRLKLFEKMRDSLMEIDTGDKSVCWVIHDDASPVMPPISTRMRFPVHLLRRAENIGQPRNYLSTAEHACELAEWVLVVDDDGLVAPDILPRMFSLVDRYPEADFYGAFNSPYHPAVETYDDHVLKVSTCEHGRFFRCSTNGFGMSKHKIPVLKPSALQHCGIYGLNGTVDDFDAEFGRTAAACA